LGKRRNRSGFGGVGIMGFLMGKEEEFNRKIIWEYLKYGSVNEVFVRNRHDLPISVAGFHRLLNRRGVVKAAGPNNKLAEAVEFMERLARERVPLERLYKKMPPSFRTSAVTLHRVLAYVKRGVVRREAVALVITPAEEERKVLMGRDVTSPKLKYGQIYGAYSLPMTFSKRHEEPRTAIRRVLQQEVFSSQTVEGKFPEKIISGEAELFLLFDVADVRLRVYQLVAPAGIGLGEFNSGKLVDYRYWDWDEVVGKEQFRVGMVEIVGFYKKYCARGMRKRMEEVAEVNQRLAFLGCGHPEG